MKKYLYILALLPLLAVSCKWDDPDKLFPEEYYKVFYIKDSGAREVAMNTAQETVVQSMLVVKAGARPEMSAECRLEVMSIEDAARQWGFSEDEIGIIPEASYKIPESVLLTEDSPNVNFEVELYPNKMAAILRLNPDKTWILPLKLVSDSGSINKDNCCVLLNCSVVSPLVGWKDDKTQPVTIDYRTLDYPVELEITRTEINRSDFTGTLEALGEEVVEEYNASHGTTYPLLPSESYSLGNLSFSAGELIGSVQLNLSRTGLTSDLEYLLPVRIKTVSDDLFELSDKVKYFIISNPKYAYAEVDPASWKIAFSNSEDRDSRYWAWNMFNRNPDSNFASYWNVAYQTRIGTDVDDFRYPDEGTYPGHCTYTSGRLANTEIEVPYPCCDGVRKYDNVVVVIDFGEPVSIHSVGLSKMAGNLGNLDLKGAEFYTEDQFTLETAAQYKDVDVTAYRAAIANYSTANAGNTWRLFLEWNDIPKGTTSEGLATVWNTTPDQYMNTAAAKGRYLKIHPTASYRAAINGIEICDLYIRKLITIDGEPVQ
ncbi:MAG: DUF1735 domain-containing protein [Bacteroidales bacterium]|nr:DUF1735 domain-containing protein [Bacteroidales bacterium]